LLAQASSYILLPTIFCSLSFQFPFLPSLGLRKSFKEIWGYLPRPAKGTSTLMRIKDQIDLIPEASLTNKLAYMSNPEGKKEMQRKIDIYIYKDATKSY